MLSVSIAEPGSISFLESSDDDEDLLELEQPLWSSASPVVDVGPGEKGKQGGFLPNGLEQHEQVCHETGTIFEVFVRRGGSVQDLKGQCHEIFDLRFLS
jgi:hypothetical protein